MAKLKEQPIQQAIGKHNVKLEVKTKTHDDSQTTTNGFVNVHP